MTSPFDVRIYPGDAALYISAAEEAHFESSMEYACTAIAWAAYNQSHSSRLRLIRNFGAYFRPEINDKDKYYYEWDAFGSKAERVLALLFMAAICGESH